MKFHPTRHLALAVQLAHLVAIAYSAVLAATLVVSWVSAPAGEHVVLSDLAMTVFATGSGLFLPAVLASGVLLIVWMLRSYHNIETLGGKTTQTPGWIVAQWFVPFVNLVAPYHTMREIWSGSDPARLAPYNMPTQSRAVVDVWWGLWIISAVLDRVCAAANPSSDHFAAETIPLQLLSMALWGLAAWWALTLVRRVTANQYELLSMVQMAGAEVEIEPIKRGTLGGISLVLAPLALIFIVVTVAVADAGISAIATTALLGFAGTCVLTGGAFGLAACWNNTPKPVTGVLGVYFAGMNGLFLALAWLFTSL